MNRIVTRICDHVLDAGVYPQADYAFAERFFAKGYSVAGGCTAAAKVTDAGETLVGRNMDLNVSRKAAYVLRTAASEGRYETVGVAYTFAADAPDYEDALENGLPDGFVRQLPFLCTDVLNSEGLYVEINMRCGEAAADGSSVFGCTGTNPASSHRVYEQLLARYLGDHCANVEEAVSYAKSLDLYTMAHAAAWNFCFLMADAAGRYGVLEIARNRVIWHEKQAAQTNFYLEPELAALEQLKCGLGRYELVTKGLPAVQSEADMLFLIKKIAYSQTYLPGACPFDPRSEFCGVRPEWTTDYVLDEAHRGEIEDEIRAVYERNLPLSREEKQARGQLWESTFTIVANCTAKTLFVRFFEDDKRAVKLGFGRD